MRKRRLAGRLRAAKQVLSSENGNEEEESRKETGGGREEAGVRGRNGRVTAQVEGWTIKSQHQQLHRSLAVSDDVDLSSRRGDGSASLSHSISSASARARVDFETFSNFAKGN